MKSGKPGTGLHCVIVLSQYYKTAMLHAMFQSIVVIDRPCKLNIMHRIVSFLALTFITIRPSSNLKLNLCVGLTNLKNLTHLTSFWCPLVLLPSAPMQ